MEQPIIQPESDPVIPESTIYTWELLLKEEPILRLFSYDHLPDELSRISRQFCRLACWIVQNLPRNPERTLALRDMLNAKDNAVRTLL